MGRIRSFDDIGLIRVKIGKGFSGWIIDGNRSIKLWNYVGVEYWGWIIWKLIIKIIRIIFKNKYEVFLCVEIFE